MFIKSHISYRWLTWGVSGVRHGDLRPEVLAKIDEDRRRAHPLRAVTRRIPIPWVEDQSVSARFIGHMYRLSDARRRFADMTFNGEPLYLEWIEGNGHGPGFGFSEVRIHDRDGIVGRAWSVGCSLGFGGSVGPAIAVLEDGLALRIDGKKENLELVRLKEPGVKNPEPQRIEKFRPSATAEGRLPTYDDILREGEG
jgi:hypothetical protein